MDTQEGFTNTQEPVISHFPASFAEFSGDMDAWYFALVIGERPRIDDPGIVLGCQCYSSQPCQYCHPLTLL